MRKLKTASLAILGAAAIFAFGQTGPAMAMTKGKVTKGEMTKGEMTKTEVKGGSKTLAKGQRHIQRHAAYRGAQFRNRPAMNAFAAVPATSAPPMWTGGVSSSDRAQYIKNLHDSGYNPKKNFNASGNLVTQ
jgi:hypothetical protein